VTAEGRASPESSSQAPSVLESRVREEDKLEAETNDEQE